MARRGRSPPRTTAKAAVESGIEVPTDKYEVDAYPAVNTLLENYCDAMAAGDADTMEFLSNMMTDEEFENVAEIYGLRDDLSEL